MTTPTHYDTEHLTYEEVKAVCKAISDQILAANSGAQPGDVLEAPMEELQDEYAFWIDVLEKRHAQATNDH